MKNDESLQRELATFLPRKRIQEQQQPNNSQGTVYCVRQAEGGRQKGDMKRDVSRQNRETCILSSTCFPSLVASSAVGLPTRRQGPRTATYAVSLGFATIKPCSKQCPPPISLELTRGLDFPQTPFTQTKFLRN